MSYEFDLTTSGMGELIPDDEPGQSVYHYPGSDGMINMSDDRTAPTPQAPAPTPATLPQAPAKPAAHGRGKHILETVVLGITVGGATGAGAYGLLRSKGVKDAGGTAAAVGGVAAVVAVVAGMIARRVSR
jgi:hypothetical protein